MGAATASHTGDLPPTENTDSFISFGVEVSLTWRAVLSSHFIWIILTNSVLFFHLVISVSHYLPSGMSKVGV